LLICLPNTLGELGSDEQICGASPHSDYGMITLLMTDGVPGLQVLVFPIVYFLFYYYGMSLVLERRNGVELLTGRGYYLPVSGFQLQIRMSRNK